MSTGTSLRSDATGLGTLSTTVQRGGRLRARILTCTGAGPTHSNLGTRGARGTHDACQRQRRDSFVVTSTTTHCFQTRNISGLPDRGTLRTRVRRLATRGGTRCGRCQRGGTHIGRLRAIGDGLSRVLRNRGSERGGRRRRHWGPPQGSAGAKVYPTPCPRCYPPLGQNTRHEGSPGVAPEGCVFASLSTCADKGNEGRQRVPHVDGGQQLR